MEHPSLLPFEHEPFDEETVGEADPELAAQVAGGLRELGEEIARMRGAARDE